MAGDCVAGHSSRSKTMFALVVIAAALVAAPPLVAAEPPPAPAAVQAPLPTAELDDVRGGQGEVVSLTEQNLSATNSGQIQADVVGSGAIGIDGAAFSNFTGVGNFVMNTGHLNNIQSSLSVTIVPAPTPGL
jgi:hypothetical protein